MRARARLAHAAGLAICAAMLLGACGSAAPVAAPTTAGGSAVTGPRWLIATSALAKLQSVAGIGFVTRYLDTPQTTIIVGEAGAGAFSAWHTSFALDVRSVQQLRTALSQGLPPRVTEVLYDPEHWSFTPAAEQDDVGLATQQAAQLARHAGLRLIVAPATNLADVLAPGQPVASAFLGSRLLSQVAVSADSVEIQAQGLESRPAQYAAFVRAAAGEVRGANPDAVLYAGLSSNPSGQAVRASQLEADISATAGEVAGYWLNVPSQGLSCPRCGTARPQVILTLLEDLRATR